MLNLKSSVLCCLAKLAGKHSKDERFLINSDIKNLKKLFLYSLALDGDCSPQFLTKKQEEIIKKGVREICGGNCCDDCQDSQIVIFQPDNWVDKVIKICTPTTTSTTTSTSTSSTTTVGGGGGGSTSSTTTVTATDPGLDFDFSVDCVDPDKKLAIYVFNLVRGIAPFYIRIDGGAWEAITSTKLYTDLTDGSHTICIKDVLNREKCKTITRYCAVSTTSTSTTTNMCPSGYTLIGGVCVNITTSSSTSTSSTSSTSSTTNLNPGFNEKKFSYVPTTDFTNWNPANKIPQFTLDDIPVIFDAGNDFIGGVINSNWEFWNNGFTAITSRSYTFLNQNKFSLLPDTRKAYEINEGEIFKDSLTLVKDPNCSCFGDDCTVNFFVVEWTAIDSYLTDLFNWNVLNKKAKHISVNIERFNFRPSYQSIVNKRNCFESGKYAFGTGDAFWVDKSDAYFVQQWKAARADFFILLFDKIKAKLDNLNVKAQMYGIGSMDAYIYSGTSEALLMSGSASDTWVDGSFTGNLGSYFDYQDAGVLYMGVPFNDLNDSRVLTEILAHYEAQIRDDSYGKAVVNHIQPFRENMLDLGPNTCTGCGYGSASKQISQAFAIVPFFLRAGSWVWGTTSKPQFGNSLEDFMAGRYLCSQVKDIVVGGERLKPEIRLQGDSQWYGDSQSWINAVDSANPNRYTGWTIQEKQSNGVAFPLVVAVKKGNQFAFAATRIGGSDIGNTVFDLRVVLGTGVKQQTFTIKDRDWVIYEYR